MRGVGYRSPATACRIHVGISQEDATQHCSAREHRRAAARLTRHRSLADRDSILKTCGRTPRRALPT
jgi:hypothetical protein